MKKRKKLLSILLAGALCLSACGAQTDNTSGGDTVATEAPAATATVEEPTPTEEPIKEVVAVPDVIPEGTATGTLTFDVQDTHQVIDGFGGAYTWYGDRLKNAQDSAAGYDALFSDAKLTVLRFKNEYNYSVEGKAANATAMAYNYKEARDRAAQYGEKITVLMCCWSPPAYLKSDNTIDTGYGTLKKNDKGEYMYKEYAEWWVESLQYYMSKGIVIDYLSIQNEVDFSPESYEGCRFDAKENDEHAGYAEAFIAVYDAIHEAFGDDAPIMLGPETMSCTSGSMLTYSKPILESRPETLGGLAYHLYVGGTADGDTLTVKPSSYLSGFNAMEEYFPDTRKWQTEFYIGQGVQTAELIWSAMVNAEMNAYVYWSAIWADSTPDKFESADLLEINNSGVWRRTANYYAMRHYGEFVRPGYTRIGTETDQLKVKTFAAANDDKNKLALVFTNNSQYDVLYTLEGTDYTITDSAVYQSLFGEGGDCEETMYLNMGKLGEGNTIYLPAQSVTTVDITGYYGDTEIPVAEIVPLTYEEGVLENPVSAEVPTEDVTILSSDFSTEDQVTAYSGFGSSIVRQVADGGEDGKGCMIIKMRSDDWNGMSLSNAYFENYGYLVKISYDVMMKEDGCSVSATSTFTVNGTTYYPDSDATRVACYDMEGGKWYHAEGYVTLYTNMEDESFRVYWESPDNTNDIYLDNVEVTILYTQPAGEYTPAE